MKLKWVLFAGILFLVSGIVLKKVTDLDGYGLFLILLGVLLKVYYIIHKIVVGEYKPGKEVIFLLVGLAFFLSGLYFRNAEASINYIPLLVLGIILKVVFIVVFIIKIRSVRNLKHKY